MTLYGAQTRGLSWETPSAASPLEALAEAARVARASSHAKRLDTATQAALQALVAFAAAAVDLARAQAQEIEALRSRSRTADMIGCDCE